MRDRTVTLLDLGIDPAFDTATNLLRDTILSMNVDGHTFDVVTVRSRDSQTIWNVLNSVGDVLHILAHGFTSPTTGPELYSESEELMVSLSDLSKAFLDGDLGINAEIVIVDACSTSSDAWRSPIRDSITHPVTYVGTRRQIGWYESAVFFPAFYGALGRRRGKGTTVAEQGLRAVASAQLAYEQISEETCPYRAKTIEPSQAAKASIKEYGE